MSMSFTIQYKYPTRGGRDGTVITRSDINIADCDPKWQFWDFLQRKGSEISPNMNFLDSDTKTFIPRLYGNSNKDGSLIEFNFNNRLLILNEEFDTGAILILNE